MVAGSNDLNAALTTSGYDASRRMTSRALGSDRSATLMAAERSAGGGRTTEGAFLRSTDDRRTCAYCR